MRFFWTAGLIIALFLIAGCGESPAPPPHPTAPPTSVSMQPSVQPVAASASATQSDLPSNPTLPPATSIPTAVPRPTVTLIPILDPSPPCGQLLPTLTEPDLSPGYVGWTVPPLPEEFIPADIQPALEYFFKHPNSVSITAYQIGYEGIGFFHNEDALMPLASVSKLIELVAYDQAAANGQIDPRAAVDLADLEALYLPRSDLGAHNQALRALPNDQLTVNDVAAMMIRYSSNSASDFIHQLVGQTVIEQTVIDLEMGPHTAPCPFLGRLIGMGQLSQQEIVAQASDPASYGASVTRWTDLYRENQSFRLDAQRLWGRGRQPSLANQAFFVDQLETRGTAAGYGRLMARLATGEVGSPELRELLGWPLDAFEDNRLNYEAIGYKNGTMPGVLTTAYYSRPYWSETPVVVIIFYKDLPLPTYRQWRRTLPNDALAHWLMINPQAIHILHVLRDSAAAPN